MLPSAVIYQDKGLYHDWFDAGDDYADKTAIFAQSDEDFTPNVVMKLDGILRMRGAFAVYLCGAKAVQQQHHVHTPAANDLATRWLEDYGYFIFES